MDCPTAPRNQGFDFVKLSAIIGQINATCTDWFVSGQLTDDACREIAGSGWAKHNGYQMWGRLTMWKLPLLQLLSQFSRPPLGFMAELFAITHFIGDPIDTIWSLLHKLAHCKSRAELWKLDGRPENEWKALTLI